MKENLSRDNAEMKILITIKTRAEELRSRVRTREKGDWCSSSIMRAYVSARHSHLYRCHTRLTVGAITTTTTWEYCRVVGNTVISEQTVNNDAASASVCLRRLDQM